MRPRRLLPLALLAVALVALVGCDSSNPITPPSPTEVEGNYVFTEFRFVPLAGGLAAANVLDTLRTEDTELRLLGSGQALLIYRIRGGGSALLTGNFDLSATQLRLRLQEDAGLARLLLSSSITFERLEGGRLRHETPPGTPVTVNLAAYDPARYQGLNQVQGRLFIEFLRVD
jgi:hypothetical protein